MCSVVAPPCRSVRFLGYVLLLVHVCYKMDAIDFVYLQLHQIQDYYRWTISFSDHRVKNWLFMSSPWPTLSLTMLYLLMVQHAPKLMKNRKPWDLKYVMIVYNIFVALLNLYITVELIVNALFLKYNWLCQIVQYVDGPREMRVNEVWPVSEQCLSIFCLQIAAAIWWYYVSKLIELSDTLFFILRKKDNQLSFLHVYHHSTMFLMWWIGVKWVAGGSAFLLVSMNSFVHVLTYSYYGLSAFGTHMQKYLWWKKHLTVIQLTQFFIYFLLGLRSLLQGCAFPTWMRYGLIIYMVIIIALFLNFYLHAYAKKPEPKREVCCDGDNNNHNNNEVKKNYAVDDLRHRSLCVDGTSCTIDNR